MRRLRAIDDVERFEDRGDVRLHRLLGDAEPRADFLVGQPRAQVPEHVDLPIGELLRSPALTSRIQCALADVARNGTGLSTTVARAMLMAQPPSIDAHETTEKGSINQRAVLANRAALVELLYAEPASADVIAVTVVQ